MMVLVALGGVACLVGREYWAWWQHRGRDIPVGPSSLSASAGPQAQLDWHAGQSVPVAITYQFGFGPSKPAPGTTCLLLAEVWFEDVGTGLAVTGYTFDAPLVVGGREAVSGSLSWDAMLPRPGRYMLRCMLNYVDPTGELRMISGEGSAYEFVAATASSQPPRSSGPNP